MVSGHELWVTYTSPDSIYYSLQSNCNYFIYFHRNDSLTFQIDGKKYLGTITPSKYDIGYFDLVVDKKGNFILGVDDGLYLVNQNYSIDCEPSKVLLLAKVGGTGNESKLADELESNNIASLNDKGYFLEQAGLYHEAIMILEQVVKKDKDRIVAYINLGDAYWGLNKKEQAKRNYETYIKLMKANGKESRIPKRVIERIGG